MRVLSFSAGLQEEEEEEESEMDRLPLSTELAHTEDVGLIFHWEG